MITALVKCKFGLQGPVPFQLYKILKFRLESSILHILNQEFNCYYLFTESKATHYNAENVKLITRKKNIKKDKRVQSKS